jgi:hypothetical protein
MTVRCSEASAAPHHGAARDTAGQDRPLPKRIGQTFSAPARRGSATSSKTSARRDPPGLYQSASPYAERAGDERDADREHGRRSADQCAARSLDCVRTQSARSLAQPTRFASARYLRSRSRLSRPRDDRLALIGSSERRRAPAGPAEFAQLKIVMLVRASD